MRLPGGSPRPQELIDVYTFPDWMNPSGGVLCSIHEYALYAMENLKGLQGHSDLVDKNSLCQYT